MTPGYSYSYLKTKYEIARDDYNAFWWFTRQRAWPDMLSNVNPLIFLRSKTSKSYQHFLKYGERYYHYMIYKGKSLDKIRWSEQQTLCISHKIIEDKTQDSYSTTNEWSGNYKTKRTQRTVYFLSLTELAQSKSA